MLKDMILVAAGCIKYPGRRAVWSPQLGSYVCPDTEEGQKVTLAPESRAYPPLNPQFTLVFTTAAVGTLFFILLCVILTLIAGEDPSLMTEIIRGLFSLAQIGFGAIVGLLGGKLFSGDSSK